MVRVISHVKKKDIFLGAIGIISIIFLTGFIITLDVLISKSQPEKQVHNQEANASTSISCADPRYGLSQGDSSALSLLKLHPNAPLFSYGVYNASGGIIHTFQPCSKNSSGTITGSMGCTDKDSGWPNGYPVFIYQRDQLISYIQQHLGNWWTVFNEPSTDYKGYVPTSNPYYWTVGAEQFAKYYNEYYQILKSADPTAKIFLPGLFQKNSGAYAYDVYTADVLQSYTKLYGVKMPISAFTMHVYPWTNDSCDAASYSNILNATKQNISNWVSFAQKIKSIGRNPDGSIALSSPGVPGDYATAEVWLTEWGWLNQWSGQRQNSDKASGGCVSNYIADITSWLETTAVSRWFYFPNAPLTLSQASWDLCGYNDFNQKNAAVAAHPDWHCWSGWFYNSSSGPLTNAGNKYSFMANRKLVGSGCITASPTPLPTNTPVPTNVLPTPTNPPPPTATNIPLPTSTTPPTPIPTSTPAPTPTPSITISSTPTPTISQNCVCKSDDSCDTSCTFDTYPDVTYNSPIKCLRETSIVGPTPDPSTKTSYCQRFERIKGDVDGDGVVNNLDYFYYVSAVNGGGIPVNVDPDVNGDGKVTPSDRAIIIRSLGR